MPSGHSQESGNEWAGGGFDPALARYRTQTVLTASVVDLLHLSHAPWRVAEYREAMLRGERFPPISVVRLGRRLLIADGHKRFSAYAALGNRTIVVEMWPWRRWLADQGRQLVHKLSQLLSIMIGSLHDPRARRAAVRLFHDTVGHWRRIAHSLPCSRWRLQTAAPATPPGSALLVRLLRECARYPTRVALAVGSLLLLAGARLALTWMAKLWAEGPLVRTGAAGAEGLLAAALALTGLMAAAVMLSRYQLASINQRMMERLRAAMQHRVLELEVGMLRRQHAGEIGSRVFNDVGALSGFAGDILKRLVGEGAVLVGALAMMFYLEWRLALAAVLMVPVVALLLGRFGALVRARSALAQRRLGGLSAALNEQLHGLTTIKGYQAEAYERTRFARHNAGYRAQVLRSERWSAGLLALVFLITGGGLVGAVWYGTQLVRGGVVSPGALLAFCLYAAQAIEPLRRLGDLQGMLQRALAAAARVYELIDSPAVEPRGGAILPKPVRGTLCCERLCFSYRAGEPVLEQLDFSVANNQPLALVSATGGGKSTLARLLVRFYQPDSGRVLLDGVDIRALDLVELRRAICVVEQDPFLFSGPLIDNLLYGAWDAPRSAIDRAVEWAGLEPLLRALPQGLFGSLAEAGKDLSGGQKQRIALARAILREPAVLVLDEATSAIDSEGEAQIFARMADWLAQRTVLVIAHRLSTVSRFARVVVLAGGRVAGDGNVIELQRSCPAFSRLFAEQMQPLITISG
ncbi:MAG: ABC transporter ATP-binding protein [Deltaproteobacteria bacterium]|nr:ABC transporter ATP-binding protein [Deltaproteobacteria bacterium]